MNLSLPFRMRSPRRVLGFGGALCTAVAAGCDVSLTEPELGGTVSLPIVAVGNPESPVLVMTGTDDTVLWIEGEKDIETGAPRSLSRMVIATRERGRENVLAVVLDSGGLPVTIEDAQGTVVRFLEIDPITGTATVRVENAHGAPRAPTVVVELGAELVAEATAADYQATEALVDLDCAVRENPWVEALSNTVLALNLWLCESFLVWSAASGATLGGAVFTCASALLGMFSLLDPAEGIRIANHVVDGVACAGRDWKSCAELIWGLARGWLSSECSYIGGTWRGSELVSIDGTIRIGDDVEFLGSFQEVSGEIEIQQTGCDIGWLLDDAIVRTGDIRGNEITVRGRVGFVVFEDGVVVEEQANSLTATGEVCGSAVFFDADGRFSARISTPEGAGSIDVTVRSTVTLRYQADWPFGADRPRRDRPVIVPDPGSVRSVVGGAVALQAGY